MRILGRPPRASLAERLDALAAAAEDAENWLPGSLVDQCRSVVSRAGDRRRLSSDHTVVALAGATGSGKSSLFNAVSGLELARVGVRRPTTSEPLACIWGAQGATQLLDWLDIPRRHQIPKESLLDSGESDALDGLVLLDLPDHDSTHQSHRQQVDRLVEMVDLFIWVMDPQKYADSVVHERYLTRLSAHAAVTVVLLNQVDTLSDQDVKTCVADLERLLVDDGLRKVPVLPVSALTGAGLGELVDLLRNAVAQRRTADDRVSADVGVAAGKLLDALGKGEPAGVSDADRQQLVEVLADAAGVDVVASAVGASYRRRALQATGWPVSRWLSRLRPDPLRRLGLRRRDVDTRLVRTSLPSTTPVQQARADTAVRALADAAATSGPRAWVAKVRTVASEASGRLDDAVDQAVAGVDLGSEQRPRWWRLVNGAQWFLLTAMIAGAGWLTALAVVAWLQLPAVPTPDVAGLPLPTLMLAGGGVLGVVVGLIARWAARVGGRRRAVTVRKSLRSAVSEVAEDVVIGPVSAEVERLRSCRTAATVALG